MAIEKLKEKAAWQLYAGVSDVTPEDANRISKYLDDYNDAIKYAEDDYEKSQIRVEDYIPQEYLETYMKSREYQGITINLKVHACGHLILDKDIRREIGLISAISESTGKRTLCAAVEGGLLDEFGYVKEDFLVVDSVALTAKFFDSLGMKTPSFEELRQMVKEDEKTWGIYEKGITCCINQCEKDSTTRKVMKYKPKNVAELSSFIAAIRPGFASLLSTFLNRESYSTGENNVDDLLKDTAHFMIYQESIMKVLSFLHLEMGETYGVIKSISKKKLKGEAKKNLLLRLENSWSEEFKNLDNFKGVWNVIEDSARYAFNAPHAYSMAGDSLYQAWMKGHHTDDFYEVAINHYQEKGKKDKIDALVKEAIKFYNYKLGDYKFGKDNRRVVIDRENKIIYPNLSKLKGFGEKVSQSLYELGQVEYSDFTEVIEAVLKSSISKTTLDKLIRIEYFSEYGDVNTLLQVFKYYDLVHGAKVISKVKADKNNIPINMLKKYGNETEKQFNKIDSDGMLRELISSIQYKELSLKEKLDNQKEILDIVTYVDPTANKRLYYVTGIDKRKTLVNISLYEIYSGKTRNVKIWTNSFVRNEFSEKDMIYIQELKKQHKREPNGEINPKTGKKVYVEVPDKFEFWLKTYTVVREE